MYRIKILNKKNNKIICNIFESQMKNTNYFLLLFLFISLINLGLSIEHKYIIMNFYSRYSEENAINNYYLNNLSNNYIYTKIKLGNDEQIVEMRIDLNNYIAYLVNKDLIKDENINTFNPKSSKTFFNSSIFFNSYTNEIYDSFLSKDTAIINKIIINDFNFAYANILSYYKDIPCGSIGFNYYKDYVIPKDNLNLIDQLKDNDIIEGYSLTINFTSNYKGQLIIGPDIDEIYPEKYTNFNKKVIKITGGNNYIYNRWGLTFNSVIVGEKELKHSKTSNFNLKENFIIATDEYSDIIYSSFFMKLINQQKCMKEEYSYNENAYTIKCDKDANITNFPILDFELSDVNMEPFHLIFDYHKLFETIGEYQYFKIIMINRLDPTIALSIQWSFGKFFFKSYMMTLNKDKKTISFYNETKNINNKNTKKSESKKNTKSKNVGLIILSIILFVLVIIIFLLLKKCIHQQIEINKKKKKNISVTEMTYYHSSDD